MDGPAEFALQPLTAGDGEATRIKAELMKDGSVDVGHIVTVFDRMEAELVRRSVNHATANATACHPHRKTVGMMIAAFVPL